jgi:hypothetical protein
VGIFIADFRNAQAFLRIEVNSVVGGEFFEMALLRSTYESTLGALKESSSSGDTVPIDQFLASNGFTPTQPVDVRFASAFLHQHGGELLLVQYRSYDPSQAFSVQPDMNVYRIKHSIGGTVVADETVKFPDKSIY